MKTFARRERFPVRWQIEPDGVVVGWIVANDE